MLLGLFMDYFFSTEYTGMLVTCYDGCTVCFHGICGKKIYVAMLYSIEIVVALY